MSDEQLKLVHQAGFHVTGRTFDELPSDVDIATLGLDSIQVMEMVAFLEEHLSIRIPDDELAEILTIDDLTAAIRRHREAAA